MAGSTLVVQTLFALSTIEQSSCQKDHKLAHVDGHRSPLRTRKAAREICAPSAPLPNIDILSLVIPPPPICVDRRRRHVNANAILISVGSMCLCHTRILRRRGSACCPTPTLPQGVQALVLRHQRLQDKIHASRSGNIIFNLQPRHQLFVGEVVQKESQRSISHLEVSFQLWERYIHCGHLIMFLLMFHGKVPCHFSLLLPLLGDQQLIEILGQADRILVIHRQNIPSAHPAVRPCVARCRRNGSANNIMRLPIN